MYPVAWAVVEKETGDTWEWFLGLLIKDLDINDSGAGWVFISDKQKVHLILVDSVSCVYNDDLVFSRASNILILTLSLILGLTQ
jgi:hypothetical protein